MYTYTRERERLVDESQDESQDENRDTVQN